jgi:hypothetical protein
LATHPPQTLADAVGDMILDFKAAQKGSPFHMKDLTDYVLGQMMVAPDTPGRILRDMKAKGKLGYTLLSRAQSLYRFS